MTLLKIEVKTVTGKYHPEDMIKIWAPALRSNGDMVVSTAPEIVKLVQGKAQVELLPGPARIQIMCGGTLDNAVRKVTIPDAAEASLRAVLEEGFEWEPEIVTLVMRYRNEAVAAATSVDEGVAAAASAATDAATSASDAATSATNAATSAGEASASEAAASASAVEASTSATNAATSAGEAATHGDTSLDAAAASIAAAWSFDGFTPAQVSDAAMRAEAAAATLGDAQAVMDARDDTVAAVAALGDAQTVLAARDNAVDAADRAEIAAAAITSPLSAPKNLPAPDITWLDTAQPGHGWVNPLGVGAIVDDPSVSVMGTQSLKITNGVARLTGLNIDLARGDVAVLFRVESLNPETEVLIQLSDTSGMANSLVFGLGVGNAPSPWYRLGEWVLATLPNPNNALGSGTVDESSITTIQARTFGEGVIHIQAVGVVPSTPGIVSFSFDDGYSSVLDAARRVLAPRGIRGTSYTIPGLVGDSGFMSLADNRELHDIHGWDIQAHTQIYYSPGGDNAPLEQEMKDARKWITTNGFGAGEHLAWAGGQSGPDIEQVARTLFRSSRTVADTQMETVPPARPHRMRAYSSIGGVGGTSVEAVKELVDRAKLRGGWLHLVFHRVVEGASTRAEDCSIADLEAIAEYVVESGLPVQTVSEVLAGEGTPPIRRRFLTQQEYDSLPAPRDPFTEFVIVGDPIVG